MTTEGLKGKNMETVKFGSSGEVTHLITFIPSQYSSQPFRINEKSRTGENGRET